MASVDDILGKPSVDEVLGPAQNQAPPDAAAPRNPLDSPIVRQFPPMALVQRLLNGSALQRSLDAFMTGGKEGFGAVEQNPLGLSPDSGKALSDAGISAMPGRPSLLRTANDAIMKPAAALGDAALRLMNAGVYGIGGVAGQVAKELGSASPEKIRDETINLLNYLMIEGGQGGHVVRTEHAPDGSLRDVPVGTMAKKEDFANAATALGGASAPPHVEAKLRQLYDQHGIHPAEAVHEAARDPTIAQALLSTGDHLPESYVPHETPEVAGPGEKPAEAAAEKPGTAETAPEAGAATEPGPGPVTEAAVKGQELAVAEGRPAREIIPGEPRTLAEGGAGLPPEIPPEPPPPSGAEMPRLEGPDTLGDAVRKILDKIDIGGVDPTRRLTWARLYTGIWNRLFPIEQAVTHTVGKDVLPVGEDPGKLAQLLAGAAGKADHFLNFGTFDFNTYENTGPSLKTILEPMQGDLDGLRAFMASVRALELKRRGITTGFDADAARQVAAAGLARYGETMAKLIDYQNEVSRYLRDSGVLSERGHAAMLQANRLYVPFSRIMDKAPGGQGFGKGSLQARNPIKRIKGSERDIVDPLETIIRNTYLYTQLAEKNVVGVKLVDMLKEAALGDEYSRPLIPVAEWERGHVTDVPDRAAGGAAGSPGEVSGLLEPPIERLPEVVDKGTDAALAHYLERQGVDTPEELLALLRTAALPPAGDEIAIFRDGKRETYRVDPDLARAMKGLDAQSVGVLERLLSLPTNLLRAGAVLTPDFALRHTFRDYLYAQTTSKGFFSPLDMARGFAGLIAKDPDYAAWLKGGGGNISMVALDRRYLQENLVKLTGETGLMNRSWNVITSPLRGLQMLTELAENASHLGAFKKALRERELPPGEPGTVSTLPVPTKADIQTAAFISRDTAVDAARRGAWTRSYNLITAFANITLQDTDRIARAFINKPGPTALKVAAGIMVPSALLWWSNHDDPRYQELPDWEKDLFWIFPTDKWVDAGPSGQFGPPAPGVPERDLDGRRQINQGIIFRLPKPFGAGVLFGSGTERMLEAFVAHNPDAFHRFAQSIGDTVIPQFFPTPVAPIINQFANRSTFTNRTLIPGGMEKFLPEYQYTPYTTETTKALGQIIAAFPGIREARTDQDMPMIGGAARALSSPILIENYIRGWSGTLGIYALTLADAALRKSGVLPDPVMPAATLADLPVIKAFTVRYPAATAQSIQDFYDRYAVNKTYYDTWMAKAREGDGLAMERIQAAGGPQIFVQLDGIKAVLTEHSQLIRDIVKNPQATSEEKRQLVDSLYFSMIKIGQAGKAMLQQVDLALPRP